MRVTSRIVTVSGDIVFETGNGTSFDVLDAFCKQLCGCPRNGRFRETWQPCELMSYFGSMPKIVSVHKIPFLEVTALGRDDF